MGSMMTSIDSSEEVALEHVAAAERAAAMPEGIDLSLARPLERIAIVGGGLMGAGIAVACLRAGLSVTLIEQDQAAAEAARHRITRLLDGAVKRSKMTPEEAGKRLSQLTATASPQRAAPAGLVVEAVMEDLEIKRSVFAGLAAVVAPDVPIATNTSYLDPVAIARDVSGPARILGLHFFSPAHIMKLLEIVKTPSTSEETLATAFMLAERLGKVAVLSGICDGFIGNRMLQAYRREADYLLADGCLPHEIDQAMRDFGMPMGPYELQDLTGLQIAYANRQRGAAARKSNERYVTVADRLCEMGRLGQRVGKGWYRYEEGDRTPQRDPEVEALIQRESGAVGTGTRRAFSSDAIQRRLLAVLINEGGHILDEGIAARSSDIDLVKIHGYGFPRARGGPMFFGEHLGRQAVLGMMRQVAEESPGSWRISDYLQADR